MLHFVDNFIQNFNLNYLSPVNGVITVTVCTFHLHAAAGFYSEWQHSGRKLELLKKFSNHLYVSLALQNNPGTAPVCHNFISHRHNKNMSVCLSIFLRSISKVVRRLLSYSLVPQHLPGRLNVSIQVLLRRFTGADTVAWIVVGEHVAVDPGAESDVKTAHLPQIHCVSVRE